MICILFRTEMGVCLLLQCWYIKLMFPFVILNLIFLGKNPSRRRAKGNQIFLMKETFAYFFLTSKLNVFSRAEDPIVFPQIRFRLCWKKGSGSDLNSKWKKIIFIYKVGRQNFEFDFVDSGLYFVRDENILYIRWYRKDPDPKKKVTDPAGQKFTEPTGSSSLVFRIQI